MSDKDVELKIGADGSQAEAEFGKVANSAEKAGKRIHETMREASYNMASSTKAATDQMNGHFSKVTESFGKVNAMLAGFTAILAGGAVFKAGIDESNKLTMEANKLGKQFGITATEASILNVAMGDVYVDTDAMLSANQKLVKSLGTNELAFKNLGVATRDQNGNFRSSLDIMLDVNGKLLTFKEGVDRNIEGQKIYGKQWGEVQGILKLTTERMEDARKKSEELGLVVGKENVEATANYRSAMNDVGDVLSAMKKSIGDALLPILTELGNWFASIGPEAVMVIKGAIGGLAAVFYGLKMAVEIVYEVIRLFVRTSVISFLAFADAASKALTLDFAGAKAAWKTGSAMIEEEVAASQQRIIDKAEANSGKLKQLFSAPTATTKKEGGEHSEGGDQKDGKTQTAAWKAELEAKKEAEGNFFKTSLAADEAFWNEKLNHVRKGSKDEVSVRHELFAIHKQMAQDKFAAEIEAMKGEQAAAHLGGQARINIAAEIARRVGETYGWESKEYMAAIKDIKKAAEDFEKEQQKLDSMKIDRARDHSIAMIGMERDQLGLRKELGQVSDQEEITQLKEMKEREYQIEVQAMQDKIALMKEEGTEKQQHLDELAKMKDKHDAEMAQLDIKSVQASKKSWDSVLGAVNGAFEKSITGMIMGTQSLKQAMANINQAILAEFVSMGVKRGTGWIANEAAMLFASRAKDTAVAASAAVGSTAVVGVKGVEATAVVGANAAEGAAGAAASQAAIPVIGPGLAIGAFAATMALILGARSMIHSSAGGEWNVPQDRLNLVHKNETILPANIATPLRAMVEGGGGMGGGHTINITAMDSRDVHRALMTGGALHKALTGLKRDFTTV
jgi:hypothetical protein